jgi:hypothetical protein
MKRARRGNLGARFLRHARFLCNLNLALLSFLIAPCRLVGFLPALLSTASPSFGGSFRWFFVSGRSHIFTLGRGGGLGLLKRMRVIGILIHARRRSKFHGRSLLLRLLLRRDAPGLRCVLCCPSGRSKSPGGRLLLYLRSSLLIHLLRP